MEVSPVQIGTAQVGPREVRILQNHSFKIHPRKYRVSQVEAGKAAGIPVGNSHEQSALAISNVHIFILEAPLDRCEVEGLTFSIQSSIPVVYIISQ